MFLYERHKMFSDLTYGNLVRNHDWGIPHTQEQQGLVQLSESLHCVHEHPSNLTYFGRQPKFFLAALLCSMWEAYVPGRPPTPSHFTPPLVSPVPMNPTPRSMPCLPARSSMPVVTIICQAFDHQAFDHQTKHTSFLCVRFAW